MNFATNFILLATLTLIASRHVHAYRIARRRRAGGGRTSNRHTTSSSSSSSSSIPQCDPNSCCSPSVCLKYMLYPETLCITKPQQQQEEARFKRASTLPEPSWPFIQQTPSAVLRQLLELPSPHQEYTHIRLTPEQEFMVLNSYERFFLRRDQLPPIPDGSVFYSAGGPVLIPESDGVRAKKQHSFSYVCPRNARWQDVRIAVNANDQLVQIVQTDDGRRQWILEESCQYDQSPVISNVDCVERERLVPALVFNSTRHVETQYIKVHCCVGIQRL